MLQLSRKKPTGNVSIIYSITLLLVASISTTVHASPPALDQARWHNRLLLIFSPNMENSNLKAIIRQINTLECETEDRDIVVGLLVKSGKSQLGDNQLNFDSALEIRQFFSIADGEFSAILVGKDGHEKIRLKGTPNLNEIFSTIDQMPMRMQEMTHAQASCASN